MSPRAWIRPLQRACVLAAALGLGYLVLRYDVVRLPETGCSPLLRFAPGDRLLLDAWASGAAPRDAILYEPAPGAPLELGLVERVEPSGAARAHVVAAWVVADNPDCAARDSRELGWIARERIRARVLLAVPW